MEELGRMLKEARERQRLSLEAISAATKIHRRHLEAIEAGDFDALPGPAYAKAFLRHYARTVGLDPEHVVALYQERRLLLGLDQEETPAALNVAAVRRDRLRQRRERRARQARRFIVLLIVVLAVAAGLIAAWPRLVTLSDLEAPAPTGPGSASTEEGVGEVASAESLTVLPGGVVESTGSLDLSDEGGDAPIGSHDAPGALQQDATGVSFEAGADGEALSAGAPLQDVPERAFGPRSGVESQEPLAVAGSGATAPAPGPREAGSAPAEAIGSLISDHVNAAVAVPTGVVAEPLVVLQARAVGECWVDVFADGSRIFTGVLEAGSEVTWTAREVLTVRFGRPEVVFLTLNGISLGRAGTGVITREFRKDVTD